jgi:hypothetical protein
VLRGTKMHRSACSSLGEGEFLVLKRGVNGKANSCNRYEDEKVFQALGIVKQEVGLPFVEYV